MTSFYSASNHFRHPWFDAGVAKRKQPISVNLAEDMDDEPDDDAAARAPPSKRRRCTTGLENGLAHMSLNNGNGRQSRITADRGGLGVAGSSSGSAYTTPPAPEPWPHTPMRNAFGPVGIVEENHDSTTTSEASMAGSGSSGSLSWTAPSVAEMGVNVLRPGSIEEPASAPEIKMGASSWYEPERDRVVITDLEGYAADSEDDEHHNRRRDGGGDDWITVEDMDSPSDVNINPAFLHHLRRTRTALDHPHHPKLPNPHPSPEDQSRALVLFRPLPFLKPEEPEESQSQPEPPAPETQGIEDDDAMDLDA